MAICDSKTKDVLPFIAMAVAETAEVVLHILYKAATLKGLKFFVHITYSHVLGTLLLLPLSFIFSRRGLPSFKLPVLYRLILLPVIGLLSRICACKGLEYSSPSLSSAISTLMPAFTFFLAVVFRFLIISFLGLSFISFAIFNQRCLFVLFAFVLVSALFAVVHLHFDKEQKK